MILQILIQAPVIIDVSAIIGQRRIPVRLLRDLVMRVKVVIGGR